MSNSTSFPNGPHVPPYFLSPPLKEFPNTFFARKRLSIVWEKAIIYQWHNLITGEVYVGASMNGYDRLSRYWQPSYFKREELITKSLLTHGYANFSLSILECLGPSNVVTKPKLAAREQKYLDMIFIDKVRHTLNVATISNIDLPRNKKQ